MRLVTRNKPHVLDEMFLKVVIKTRDDTCVDVLQVARIIRHMEPDHKPCQEMCNL